MNRLTVVKIGGNVIDDPEKLKPFLKDFSELRGLKLLVHGGGKIATQLSDELGIEANIIEGRRITNEESLRVVTMVYAGLINKNIVAQLQAFQCNAIGLSGADGNLIKATKRPVKLDPSGKVLIDYGFVGDLNEQSINSIQMKNLLEAGFIPVFSAITHDGNSQLLNTNADTIASAISAAMAGFYRVSLVYCFEKKGVLTDVSDENTIVREINLQKYTRLKEGGIIYEGMIPKLDNAFKAISNGVNEVFIGKSDEIAWLNKKVFGTRLIP
jgi:acetylglutamate kinase